MIRSAGESRMSLALAFSWHKDNEPGSSDRLHRIVERLLDRSTQWYGMCWLILPANSINSVD